MASNDSFGDFELAGWEDEATASEYDRHLSLAAVDAAVARLGGERIDADRASGFWTGQREQTDEYFVGAMHRIDTDPAVRLWRLSVPQTAAPLAPQGDQLIKLGGRPALGGNERVRPRRARDCSTRWGPRHRLSR